MANIETESKEIKDHIRKTKEKSYLYEMKENGESCLLVENIESEDEIEEDIVYDRNDTEADRSDLSDTFEIPEEIETEEEHLEVEAEIPEYIECE